MDVCCSPRQVANGTNITITMNIGAGLTTAIIIMVISTTTVVILIMNIIRMSTRGANYAVQSAAEFPGVGLDGCNGFGARA